MHDERMTQAMQQQDAAAVPHRADLGCIHNCPSPDSCLPANTSDEELERWHGEGGPCHEGAEPVAADDPLALALADIGGDSMEAFAAVAREECPKCAGSLDVGWECNKCQFDAEPLANMKFKQVPLKVAVAQAVIADVGTLRVPVEINDADISALAAAMEEQSQIERDAAAAHQAKVDAAVNTRLGRAYMKLRLAKTGREIRQARSQCRHETRKQLVRTMCAKSDHFRKYPHLAKAIAANIVRLTQSTHK